MINKIKDYVNTAFENAPNTKGVNELKEEMICNLIEKYNDLVEGGKAEEEAYRDVIKSIGNIDKLVSDLRVSEASPIDMEEKKKRAKITATAVALYILSPVMVIFFEEVVGQDTIGVIFMFITVAIATGLLVYNNSTKPKSSLAEDDLVEEFMQWRNNKKRRNVLYSSLSGALWLITVALYMIISFATNKWEVTWVIFIIAAAVQCIFSGVIKLRGDRYE